MQNEESDIAKAVAKKKVKFPSSSANTAPKKKRSKRKKEETVRLLGYIARGER